MFRTSLAICGAALCAATFNASATAPAAAAPTQFSQPADVVSAFHDTLTDAMNRSAKLGCEGRASLVQPAVDRTFDLPFLTERVLRRSWKTLDAAQRTAFSAALRGSVIATYATEFAEPGAVHFSTGDTEPLASGDALVHAMLAPRQGSAIALDYVLKPRGGSWQVVNVVAEGVSDLALRATQYEGLMKTEGFDALIARLEAQTRKLKARCQ